MLFLNGALYHFLEWRGKWGEGMWQKECTELIKYGTPLYNRAIETSFNVESEEELTFVFPMKAPNNEGIYYESFKLVSEYIKWFGPIVTWKITVI